MEINQHIGIVGSEAKLLALAADQGGLDINVPSCPGWDMRELLRHLGMIHLWAAGHMAALQDDSWGDDLTEFTKFWPDLGVFWPDDKDLINWYLDTNTNLVNTLESAAPDEEHWTFLPSPSPLAMWARRQAHETAVHRFDGENAAGIRSEFDDVFAADGIDELLSGFATRKEECDVETPVAMHVATTDTNDHWLVTIAPDGISTSRDDAEADVTLTGTSSDLYLALWNRGDDSRIAISGDRDIFNWWHSNYRVRWTR